MDTGRAQASGKLAVTIQERCFKRRLGSTPGRHPERQHRRVVGYRCQAAPNSSPIPPGVPPRRKRHLLSFGGVRASRAGLRWGAVDQRKRPGAVGHASTRPAPAATPASRCRLACRPPTSPANDTAPGLDLESRYVDARTAEEPVARPPASPDPADQYDKNLGGYIHTGKWRGRTSARQDYVTWACPVHWSGRTARRPARQPERGRQRRRVQPSRRPRDTPVPHDPARRAMQAATTRPLA
ncbi:hypothetical protein SB85_09235 [Xanthomonas sacchari]|nr:hypothetical protein SB85_09235 [Xanthomonas sacchari]